MVMSKSLNDFKTVIGQNSQESLVSMVDSVPATSYRMTDSQKKSWSM